MPRADSRIVRQAAWSLGVLVLAAVAWLFLTQRHAPMDPRIDPGPFREQITRFEACLYHTGGGADARVKLREAGQAVQVAFGQAGPSFPKAAREDLAPYFLVTVDRGDSVDYPSLRQDWEERRARHFRSADWFLSGSSALDQAQRTAEARGIVTDIAAYEATLAEIRALLLRIESVAQSLPDGDWDGADPAAGERWQEAKNAAAADVVRIKGNMPAPPREADASWTRAWGRLNQALQALPRVFWPGEPTREMALSRVANGKVALAEAEKALQQAER